MNLALRLAASHPVGDELLRAAYRLAVQLPAPSRGSEVAFAFERDRGSFAVALLACWLKGHIAAVPGDASRHSFGPLLARPNNVGFLHDTGIGLGVDVPRFLLEPAVASQGDLEAASPDGEPALMVFRSEESEPGESWSNGALMEAIDAEGQRAGIGGGDSAVGCTLAPMSRSGLFLGLLLPLSLGREFTALVPSGTEKSLAWMAQQQGGVIVTSRDLARRLRTRGVAPTIELLVEEHPDDRLGPKAQGMAQALLEINGVTDAACTYRSDPSDPSAGRWLVAVACEPESSADVESAAAEHLSGTSHELRVVPAVPRDQSGWIILPALYLMFGLGRDGAQLEHGLEFLPIEGEEAEGVRRFSARIPMRFAAFEGHFEGEPILAGAMQLDRMVLPCLRRAWPDSHEEVTGLSRVKFAHRVDPGDAIEVVLTPKGQGRCSFAIERGGTVCTSGILKLAPVAAPDRNQGSQA